MPAKPRKTWTEKLEGDPHLPKVIKLTGAAVKRWGGRTMVVPSPREVDALMRTVPRGRLTTIGELRSSLARSHRTDAACPITTGIFSWISAHAAEEAAAAGKKKITPYWRTLKKDGELNPKYPGGVASVRSKLAAEGHRFVARGKRVCVQDYAAALVRPTV